MFLLTKGQRVSEFVVVLATVMAILSFLSADTSKAWSLETGPAVGSALLSSSSHTAMFHSETPHPAAYRRPSMQLAQAADPANESGNVDPGSGVSSGGNAKSSGGNAKAAAVEDIQALWQAVRDLQQKVKRLEVRNGSVPRGHENSGSVSGDDVSGGDPSVLPSLATPSAAGAGASAQAVRPSDQEAYKAALALLRKRRFSQAEKAFERFVRDYPQSSLRANAYYWLGESFYAQNRYEDAVAIFANALEDSPNSSKADDTLLKLALGLKALRRLDEACVALQALLSQERERKPAVYIVDRAQGEAASLSCS